MAFELFIELSSPHQPYLQLYRDTEPEILDLVGQIRQKSGLTGHDAYWQYQNDIVQGFLNCNQIVSYFYRGGITPPSN